jgi:NADPH:quinone reductase-like Zn-dependent oxidoreductase
MKAIVQDRYGAPDVLELRELEPPELGEDDLLLRVRAAGVDPGVWHLTTGLPYMVRLANGVRAPNEHTRGLDVAGTVEAVGQNVTVFKPGDDVFGTCAGSFAEYARARERRLAAKPTNLSFEQCAAVGASGYTALQALRDKGELQEGERLLVIGAGGGVGTFAVQIGKALGATVTGVCSTGKVELVRGLGADRVIDYTEEEFHGGEHYDVIVETAGRRPLLQLRRALAPGGRLVLIAGNPDGRFVAGLDRQLRAAALSPFVSQKLRPMLASADQDDLETLRGMMAEGKLTPVIDRTYPLAEAVEALRYVHAGHAAGKVVLTI